VDATYAVLDAAVDRILGRPVAVAPVELARDLDAALGVLRQRAHPLDNPLPRRRGRSSYARAVRVFTAVDHYVRLLARISDVARAPDWAETLLPAVAQIWTNVDGLRALLMHVDGPEVISAERAGGPGRGARRPPRRARAAQPAPGGHAAAAADGPGGVRLRGRPRRAPTRSRGRPRRPLDGRSPRSTALTSAAWSDSVWSAYAQAKRTIAASSLAEPPTYPAIMEAPLVRACPFASRCPTTPA
jgi:hypothetical protein